MKRRALAFLKRKLGALLQKKERREAPAPPAPEPTPAPEPAPTRAPEPVAAPTFSFGGMCRAFGLTFDADVVTVSRKGRTLYIDEAILYLEVDDISHRELIWSTLLAYRLAIDTMEADWSPEIEREKPPEVYHQKQQVPSVYGERLPLLVPDVVRETWESLTGERAVVSSLPGSELVVLHVLEVGIYQHVLSHADLEQLERAETGLDLSNIISDARGALFYQSYKVRPVEEKRIEGARLRLYSTREGLGSARATLLPDFDYDASKKRGHFIIASRDHLLVSEPASLASKDRDFARQELEAWAATIRAEARFPILQNALALPQITGEQDQENDSHEES